MKFSLKIFYIFTSLFIIVFNILGMRIISETFLLSLDREIQRVNSENQIFQFTLEMSLNTLPNYSNGDKDKSVERLARSIAKNIEKNGSSYKVYNDQKELVFSDTIIKSNIKMIDSLVDGKTCGYQIHKQNNKYYLILVYKMNTTPQKYYLETIKDISPIYSDRDQMLTKYYRIMFSLLILIGLIILGLSHFLTKSIAELSRITRRFSDGNYNERAIKYSDDEIGELAKDFNAMADTISQKMEQLVEAARKQEDFTASFTHELRTPLTSIIGYADMLRSMRLSPEETINAANYIYTQGKRLENLSSKLLELIIIQKQSHQFLEFDIEKIMAEVKKLVLFSLSKKSLHLYISLEKGSLWGEKELLISLFVNLIENSRKALDYNGSIWVTGKNLKNGYELTFLDNGCGIPQEEISKITEAFYMIDKSRTRKEGGAGLGLTLCNKIIKIHHAHWTIESEEGKGCQIKILFPHKELNDEVI